MDVYTVHESDFPLCYTTTINSHSSYKLFSSRLKQRQHLRVYAMIKNSKWIQLAFLTSTLLYTGCSVLPNKHKETGVDPTIMDTHIKPGEDFYRYANGKWLEQTAIPDDKASYSSFSIVSDQARDDVHAIIATLADTNYPENTDGQRINALYQSYLDIAARTQRGVLPLHQTFKNIDRISSREDLAIAFGQGTIYGQGSPFAFWIDSDEKQPDKYRVYLTQSGLGLPNRDYYLKKDPTSVKVRKKYLAHIQRMFEHVNETNARVQAKRVLDLETQLAQIQWSNVENRNREKTYNVTRLASLEFMLSAFDWQTYLNVTGISDVSELVVRQPSYLKQLNTLLQKTAMRDWHAYLKWHTLSSAAPYLTPTLDDENFKFYSGVLYGVAEKPDTWERGVRLVNKYLGQAVGRFYVKKHFPHTSKERMDTLVDNLQAAFSARIDTLEWLSESTRQEAKEKLENFTTKIGYPDQWQSFSGLTIKKDDLYGNIQRLKRFYHAYHVNKLGQPVNKNEWYMSPQTVNAYYNPSWNEIVFPAAILQPPFFYPKADDAVNYGAIGAVIGHEISHGFDDQGALSDGYGVLRNWWQTRDFNTFKKRTQLLVQQFSQYQPLAGGPNINGALTLGENIADLSGVSVAYQAYQRSLQGKEAPIIDGLTGDQRFLLGYAQMWKAQLRPNLLKNRLITGPHSPPEYRVNGIVRNLDVFYKAFNISPDDALYLPPDQRVRIW